MTISQNEAMELELELEAMEMWIWRRLQKISSVDKISNEEVLQRINETKNSSGDEIANMNFYAVRPEGTRIR